MSNCCNHCLNDYISCLQDGQQITLNIGGLNDGETYLAKFTDAQGNTYEATFDYDGNEKVAVIEIGDGDNQIPAALFNPHIGDITLEIEDLDTRTCTEFFLYVPTRCISLAVVPTSGAYAKTSIGLEIPASV